MAYYGPNAEILGNINLSIWQFQNPIKDINSYLFNVALWVSADVSSVVINGILLWKFCNTNVLKVLKNQQKKFGYIVFVMESYLLTEVTKLNFFKQ